MTKKKRNTNKKATSSSSSFAKITKSSSRTNSSNNRNTRLSTKSISYFCDGCNHIFNNKFDSSSQFIQNHMLVHSVKCKAAVKHCPCCNKDFMNESTFMYHLNKTNNRCKVYHNKRASSQSIAHGFNKSQVNISLVSTPDTQIR